MRRLRQSGVWGLLFALCLCIPGPCVGQDATRKQPDEPPAKTRFVPKITVGKLTTWAVEPVGPEGFVDYLSVINRKYGRGVTPENNSVVLLYQALGPAPDGTRQPDEFFQLLGIDPLPDEGPYYEELWTWWKRTGRPLPPGGNEEILKREGEVRAKPWTPAEYPEVEAWLKEIEVPLGIVKDATARSEYFSPVVSPDGARGKVILVKLPGVQLARSLARTLIIRAMMHLGNKDGSRAWTDLVAVHRLGRLVGRGPTILEGLVGIAIESMAIEAELKLISETHPSTKFVARYVQQLETLPPLSSMADKVDFAERIMFLDFCHQFALGRLCVNDLRGGENDDGWLSNVMEEVLVQSTDWDEVLRSGNRWYDRIVSIIRMPGYRDRELAIQKLDAEIKKLQLNARGSAVLLQLIGKSGITQLSTNFMISLIFPATRQCIRAETRGMQRFRNLEIAIALSAWRSEHVSYPETLAELQPQYLKSVPTDLFNDQPLNYVRTPDGYWCYSVGENGIDDQGSTYGEKPGADDLIIQMPMSH